jgi:hypothetical protein
VEFGDADDRLLGDLFVPCKADDGKEVHATTNLISSQEEHSSRISVTSTLTRMP